MAVVAAVSPCPRSWTFSPGPAKRGGSTAAGLAVVTGGAAVVAAGAFEVVAGAAEVTAGAADVAGAFVVAAGVVLGGGGLPFTCRIAESCCRAPAASNVVNTLAGLAGQQTKCMVCKGGARGLPGSRCQR